MTDFNEMSGGVDNLAANSPVFASQQSGAYMRSILPARRRGQDAGGQRSSLLAHRLLHRKTAKPSPLWRAASHVSSKSNISDVLRRTPLVSHRWKPLRKGLGEEHRLESTIVMINLFGAVALLLFGLAQVKDGASRALGSKLRTGLATGTKSSVRSFLTGFVATVALQSSTATALMVSSFVERELIKPRMAQVVLLGANVGTAVTAWIVATGIEWISPFLLVVGIVLYRGGSTSRQVAGTAMIGIALMLLSLHLLSAATEPLRHSQALGAFIGLLNNAWPVAMIFAAVIAFVSSSSLAAVVLILSLASTGLLSGGLVVALVLGANLGGAIPPVIAALSGPAASRRVTLGNLIVRAIGCVLTLPAAGILADWLSMLPSPTPSYRSMRIWPSTSLWRSWPGHFPNSSRAG